MELLISLWAALCHSHSCAQGNLRSSLSWRFRQLIYLFIEDVISNTSTRLLSKMSTLKKTEVVQPLDTACIFSSFYFKYCACMCGTGGHQDLFGYCWYPDRVKFSGMFAGYLQLHRHPPHAYCHWSHSLPRAGRGCGQHLHHCTNLPGAWWCLYAISMSWEQTCIKHDTFWDVLWLFVDAFWF